MPPNPFFVGKPTSPEHFIGRRKEIAAAVDQLAAQGHIAIYGAPGMGKSSLLRYLGSSHPWDGNPLWARAVVVNLNCTDVTPFTPSAFWRRVLEELQATGKLSPSALDVVNAELGKPAPWDKSHLRRALHQMAKDDRVLLLFLDDYDAALHAHATYTEADMLTFLSELRNLAVHTDEGRHFASVVTTFRRLSELGPRLGHTGSPWYNHYMFRALQPFSDKEVLALLGRMPGAWTFTDAQRSGIRELAGGHPALLQNACSLHFESLRDEEDPTEELLRRFIVATEHFFRDAWEASTPAEQTLMMLVALSNLGGRVGPERKYDVSSIDSIFSQMDRELRDLEERAILRRVPIPLEDGHYHFFVSALMEWWVIKEIESAADESEIEKRRKNLVGLSKKQVDQVMGVMKQAWKHKDAIKAILKWVGGWAGSFVKGFSGA